MTDSHPQALTRAAIFQRAWPLILANISWPLLGLVDTAIIGNAGTTTDMAAIALGALIFTFVYWSFGCLRMSTTGFTAQAHGANDAAEIRAILMRSLLLATAIGWALVLLQWPIQSAAFTFFQATETAEAGAQTYFSIRVWGAPASLATFALMGTMVGLGKSKLLLFLQLFLNGTNMVLDLLLAGVWQLGAVGIAIGTLMAEWMTFLLALFLLLQNLRKTPGALIDMSRILNREKIIATFTSNSDIFIRTIALVFGFVWFTDNSARFGDTVLAANHVLLQFMTLSACFLDGYAFVVEAIVGKAKGARDKKQFKRGVRLTTEWAAIAALVLALLAFALGDWLIYAITDIAAVRVVAVDYLPLVALCIFASFPAFQLDGIFIGATETREMRNSVLVALVLFMLLWWLLPKTNTGLWLAWISFSLWRMLGLLYYYPALKGRIASC